MTVAISKSAEPRTRRWTREEFYRLAEEGYFHGQRVILLEGEIIEMAPQGHAHAKAIWNCQRLMSTVFGEKHWIRVQMPLSVNRFSDPEPDIAVTKEPAEFYHDHPTSGLIVIEVSDTSLEIDRRKAAGYAAAGVSEYWIVNLPEQTLEVYRNPDPSREQYDAPKILKHGDQIAPLARPQAMISVTELLS